MTPSGVVCDMEVADKQALLFGLSINLKRHQCGHNSPLITTCPPHLICHLRRHIVMTSFQTLITIRFGLELRYIKLVFILHDNARRLMTAVGHTNCVVM